MFDFGKARFVLSSSKLAADPTLSPGTHCQFAVLTDDCEDEEMIQKSGIDFEVQRNLPVIACC